MRSYFSRNYSKLKYPKADEKTNGLRNAQLGAIHSISSFFTLNKSKAAIVVMPTGSGKTAVLMMTPYVLESTKVLIITPSKLVRSQVAGEYSTLKTLTKINALPCNIKKPQVYEIKSLYKEEQDSLIEDADIIVATPQVGLSLSKAENIKRKFDLVLIDEAHHVPAKTWTEILENINESGESYRISAGSDVSQVIDPSTGRLYSSGHVFCKATSEEQQITIGYSSGSKIWSSAYANLKDFVSWCDLNGAKIFNSEMVVKTNTNFDYLPIPKRLKKYPKNIYFADLSGESYANPSLVYDKTENILGIITDLDIRIIDRQDDSRY